MSSAKESIRGARAKAFGQYFENIIELNFRRNGFHIEKIPSGCRWSYFKGAARPIPVQTPFDYIAASSGTVIIFDAKTISGSSFGYSSIEPHQRDSLVKFGQAGILSGYIIWFREIDSIVFYSANTLKNLRPRCSLKVQDGIFLGSKGAVNLGVIHERSSAS